MIAGIMLRGDGIPAERLGSLATGTDLMVDRSGDALAQGGVGGLDDQQTILALDNPTRNRVDRAFEGGFGAIIEVPEQGGRERVAQAASVLLHEGAALHVCVSTATAMAEHLGSRFAQAAARRAGILCRDDMDLAVHEAVANACLHGNLGLESAGRADPRAFLDFSMKMDDRLADPAFADRPVMLDAFCEDRALRIRVTDSGDGFDASRIVQPSGPSPAGRGLMLIRDAAMRMRHSQNGRCLDIWFAL